MIGSEKKILILWGHEHRLSFYQERKLTWTDMADSKRIHTLNFYGRCVGHGGYPLQHKDPLYAEESGLLCYDDRLYHWTASHPGPYFPPTVGFNGYVILTFTGPDEDQDQDQTQASTRQSVCLCKQNHQAVHGYHDARLQESLQPRTSLIIDYYTLGVSQSRPDKHLLTANTCRHVAREQFTVKHNGDADLLRLQQVGMRRMPMKQTNTTDHGTTNSTTAATTATTTTTASTTAVAAAREEGGGCSAGLTA